MCEYLVDDRLVLDRGNDPGLSAADAASLYIDVEDPLESFVHLERHANVQRKTSYCVRDEWLLCAGRGPQRAAQVVKTLRP